MSVKNKQPLVSVIVPVYNVEAYLDQCITSIIKQTYYNLDIILVDDESPDNCGKICDQYAFTDARIHVIHKKHGGLSEARNIGIEKAAGEYLCFIDSDDYINLEMIERLVKAIEKTSAEIAVCNFSYEYETDYLNFGGKTYTAEEYQIAEEQVLSGREIMYLMTKGKYAFCEVAWNKLYKKELFSKLKYPVGKIHEDEFLFHHLIYPCGKIAIIPYIGYHYLQRRTSIMGQKKNYLHIIEAYLDRVTYLVVREEKDLALYHEGLLLSAVKHSGSSISILKLKALKYKYFNIICSMYHKKWISFLTLCKRFVRCLIF